MQAATLGGKQGKGMAVMTQQGGLTTVTGTFEASSVGDAMSLANDYSCEYEGVMEQDGIKKQIKAAVVVKKAQDCTVHFTATGRPVTVG